MYSIPSVEVNDVIDLSSNFRLGQQNEYDKNYSYYLISCNLNCIRNISSTIFVLVSCRQDSFRCTALLIVSNKNTHATVRVVLLLQMTRRSSEEVRFIVLTVRLKLDLSQLRHHSYSKLIIPYQISSFVISSDKSSVRSVLRTLHSSL